MTGTGTGDRAAPKPPVLNIANVLTILRLALVPVFVAFLFAGPDTDGWRYAAFGAYAVAAVTDQIDGSIARRRGLVTDFGILVDPIADKALTGAALVSLSILGELPWAVTVVVAVREIGVTLLRLWVIRYGVIAASRGGKAKTLLLNISLGLYVLPLAGVAASGRAVILACGVVVAVVTGADYVYRALALRRQAGPELPQAQAAQAQVASESTAPEPTARELTAPDQGAVTGPGRGEIDAR
ncbi:CDP-alcohol phosphatidyltransferase family protein [Parafrankia discariae]|uniref:CDP-alcohol phosphatidyltransferase family protein n=1 Tax=Parafrankia discariae TaxID=365528 RepID=UPI00037FD371|nr:CDP-alcohol phosphatidyltransferase family protein [Parafrankia discariae]